MNNFAKPTFGTLVTLQYASDYIANKKTKRVCSTKKCRSFKTFEESVNKTELNYNLYTEQNLKGVDVLEKENVSSTSIDPSLNFTQNYTIDPRGELFGNTPCGWNRFTHYTQLNLYDQQK